jgi:hypothetical protein
MDMNVAAWMIAGGPHAETIASLREREQLQALRESRRLMQACRDSIVDRIRALVRPTATEPPELACCTG